MKQKQNKTAHGCLQFIAALVVIVFVMATVPITLVAGLSRTVTNRENIKSVISVDDFVREFMILAIEADVQQKYSELNLPLTDIDRRGLARAVDLVVPVDWVDNALNDGIDNIYNFLEEGRTDDYVLDYTPLIAGFQSESGRQAMTIIVSQYPPCPSSQVPPIVYENRNVEITCLPPSIPVSQFANQIHSTLVDGFINDPEIIANGGVERITWSEMDPTVVEDIRMAFDIVDQLWLLWLIPLGLLVLIAILAVRSLYSLGIWFGWPFLLTGLLTPVAGLWLSFQYSNLLQTILSEMGTTEDPLGQIATFLVARTAYSLRNIWLGGVLLPAVTMLVIGIGGLILAIYLKRRKPKSLPDPAPHVYEKSVADA